MSIAIIPADVDNFYTITMIECLTNEFCNLTLSDCLFRIPRELFNMVQIRKINGWVLVRDIISNSHKVIMRHNIFDSNSLKLLNAIGRTEGDKQFLNWNNMVNLEVIYGLPMIIIKNK